MGKSHFTFEKHIVQTIVDAFNYLLDNKLGYYGRSKEQPNDLIVKFYKNKHDHRPISEREWYSTLDGRYQIILGHDKYEEGVSFIDIIANGCHIDMIRNDHGLNFPNFSGNFEIFLSEYCNKKIMPVCDEEGEQYRFIPIDTDLFYTNFVLHPDIRKTEYEYDSVIYEFFGFSDDDYYDPYDDSDYYSDDDNGNTIYRILEALVDGTVTPAMFNMQVVEE